MKLLINSDIVSKDVNEDELEYFIEILEELNVRYTKGNDQLIILQQKIVIEEIDMNWLFSDVFYVFDYDIRYAWLGGYGCDFALEIIGK